MNQTTSSNDPFGKSNYLSGSTGTASIVAPPELPSADPLNRKQRKVARQARATSWSKIVTGQVSHVVLLFEVKLPVNNVQIRKNRLRRIAQGDVFSDVECIEHVTERRGIVEVSKIVFPLVVFPHRIVTWSRTRDIKYQKCSALRSGPRQPQPEKHRLGHGKRASPSAGYGP
jgi:hypothetical protein